MGILRTSLANISLLIKVITKLVYFQGLQFSVSSQSENFTMAEVLQNMSNQELIKAFLDLQPKFLEIEKMFLELENEKIMTDIDRILNLNNNDG